MDIFNNLDNYFFEMIKNLFGIDDLNLIPKIKTRPSYKSKYNHFSFFILSVFLFFVCRFICHSARHRFCAPAHNIPSETNL